MIVAGLDLSLTSAGVAVLDKTQATYYTFGYSLKKTASERSKLERVINIANSVMGVLHQHKVQRVGVENYAFGGNFLTMQADLGGTIKTQIYVGLRTVPILLPSKSIRKYLLGKQLGNSLKDKKAVMEYIVGRGFPKPENYDQSDAMAVALVVDDYVNYRSGVSETGKLDLFERIDYQQMKQAH